jgi:hypothetical protein
MDLLQRCQQCHHSNHPQSGLREFSVENLYPPTQLQPLQSVCISSHHLVGYKEERREDPALRDFCPIPYHVWYH